MRKEKEARRQLFHLLFGICLVAVFHFELFPLWIFFLLVMSGIIIFLTWEQSAEVIIAWFFETFERDGSTEGKGALLYCIGCFLTLLFFPKNVALAAIMILALGDSISHCVGKFYGKIKHPFNKRKNAEGTAAGIVAGFIGASLFVPLFPAFVAAFVAISVEAIEWKIGGWSIDDNLLIPLVAGFILVVVM